MSHPTKFVKIITPIAFAISLVACGDGASFGGVDNSTGGGFGGAGGSVPSNDDVFNKALNGKCKLFTARGSGFPVTSPAATTIVNTSLFCRSDTPLTQKEALFLERFDTIENFALNTKELENLNNMPKFPNLTYLELKPEGGVSKLSDITKISQYTSLIKLELARHNVTDISPIAELTNLKDLYISNHSNINKDSYLTDISPISALSNLEKLRINFENVTNIDAISGLTALKEISFTSNNISDISSIQALPNLSSIWFENNVIKDIGVFSSIQKTAVVSLESNRVSDDSALIGWEGALYLNDNCIQSRGQVSCDTLDARIISLMQMGSGSDGDFSEGVLAVENTNLGNEASTLITTTLVGPSGYISDRRATVKFSSVCIENGDATITHSDGSVAIDDQIESSNGVTVAKYTATGCDGADIVTATTTLNSIRNYSKKTFNAEATINTTK